MATSTGGTSATNTLTPGLKFSQGGMSDADIATMQLAFHGDSLAAQSFNVAGDHFSRNGQLHVPGRGFLKMLPGDWVFVDPQGWPILVSAYSIATGGWVHSP